MVVRDGKMMFLGQFVLQSFDFRINHFNQFAAFGADQMVMVGVTEEMLITGDSVRKLDFIGQTAIF
jgi:hypothetical protein